ncbi:anti-phage defense ZorAB system ZorA [Massilia sp. NEAU-DD11]|uniref:Anti-phage defense ZorAB system ZorA n=1 Tax=Massilia cellulosiltytica TaxID=2683234 RepID=A0A7X3G5S9_9BURK|nr:anti-phage ZorAB system protein ZorA [Telluria cellulosilytica]MVW64211.1 anti-phage defense ZorAB system ZorA [Telluria cellulosilytica]
MSTLFHDPIKLIAPTIVIVFLSYLIVQFVRHYRLPAGSLERALQRATGEVTKVRELAPAARREAAQRVFNDTVFAHHWSEFQETLHDQYHDEAGERRITRTRATVPSSHYFSSQSIVDTPLRTEYFKHLPGILTGLGIIGTFLGLMLGLNQFDPGTPEEVQESVRGLLHDVLFAFVGSFTAIVAAMIVTHVEKKWLRACYAHLEALTDAIDHLFDAGVGEEYLAELVRTSQESSIQTRMLKDSLVTDLREMLQNLVDTQVRESVRLAETLSGSYRESGSHMASQISQSIESSLRTPLEKIADSVSAASGDQSKMVGSMLQEVLVAFMAKLEGTFGQQFQGMSVMLEQSVSSMQQMQAGISALVNDLRNAGAASNEAMSQQLAKTLQDMHSGQELMQSTMNNMVLGLQAAVESMGTQGVEAGGKIAAQLERMFADAELRQQKMTEQMDVFVQQMQDSVGRGQSDTVAQIAGTVRQLEQQMQTMIDGVGQSITRAQEEGLRSVTVASEGLTTRIDHMFTNFDRRRESMDQQSQAALQQFQQQTGSTIHALGNQVDAMFTTLDKGRQDMDQQAHAAMQRFQEQTGSVLIDLGSQVGAMFANLDKGRHDMDRQAQEALQRFHEASTSALHELGGQVRSLVELVERERLAMRQTIETLGGQTERSLQGMQTGADKMRQAAERFDAAGGQVHDALRSSTDMVSSLRASAVDIAGSMRDLGTVVADYRAARDAAVQNMSTLESVIATAQQEAGLREKAVADLTRLSTQIQTVNRETEEYLEKIASAVGRTFDDFGHGMERSLQKTMGSLDTQLDKAIQHLAGGVEDVKEYVEELSEAMGKLANRTVRS